MIIYINIDLVVGINKNLIKNILIQIFIGLHQILYIVLKHIVTPNPEFRFGVTKFILKIILKIINFNFFNKIFELHTFWMCLKQFLKVKVKL